VRIALTLAPLVFFAAVPAAPPPAAGTGAAVNQSTLQTFTKEGFRDLLLRAAHMNVTREQVDMTDMHLTVFSGDATARIEKILLSPAATFLPDAGIVRGEKTVRFILGDDLEATGVRWTYDNKEKRISMDGNVRVVFNAELQDILK
jgi:hypothetical protein